MRALKNIYKKSTGKKKETKIRPVEDLNSQRSESEYAVHSHLCHDATTEVETIIIASHFAAKVGSTKCHKLFPASFPPPATQASEVSVFLFCFESGKKLSVEVT